MSQKLARIIVKIHVPLLILCLVFAAVCVPGVSKTTINYDLSSYLEESSMTRQGLQLMLDEFGESAALQMMVKGGDEASFRALLSELQTMPVVSQVSYDENTGYREKEGVCYRLITMMLGEGSEASAVAALENAFGGRADIVIAGSAASSQEFQQRIAAEIPIALGVALLIVLAVLLLTSHAWIEPFLIIVTLLVSILINMGTNFIFSSISFITFAVCAILQLALSMDYAIMLLNSYQTLNEGGLSPREAIVKAIKRTLMPISSSALTTVAGLMSLSFMSFKIGIDIGVVLSKGVIISLITVFLLMPSLILIFSSLLKKTRHRALPLGGARAGGFCYKARNALPLIALPVIAAAFVLQAGNTYIFSDITKDTSARQIAGVFGKSSQIAVLIPKDTTDEGYARQQALIDQVKAYEADGGPLVTAAASMVTTGAQALTYYTKEDISREFGVNSMMVNLLFAQQGWGDKVRADTLLTAVAPLYQSDPVIAPLFTALDTANSVFNGKNCSRIILDLNMMPGDEGSLLAVGNILSATQNIYGDGAYLTGELVSAYDISTAFSGDLIKVNLITALAIFLIVCLSFRSIPIAALLIFVIEGAIAATMSISRVLGEPILFMAYLICVAIQMGATIDYGILLTSHYTRLRKTMEKREALCHAMERALPTILTSGTIFIGAGSAVALLCSVFSIYSIGTVIARGAFVSVLLVLILLPALLALADPFIVKKQDKARQKNERRGFDQ